MTIITTKTIVRSSLAVLCLAMAAGCSSEQQARDIEAAPAERQSSVPSHTPHSIRLDDGRMIEIPKGEDGSDFLASEWSFTTFSPEEAQQIQAACNREIRKVAEETKSMFPSLPKPLNWLCKHANTPEKFQG